MKRGVSLVPARGLGLRYDSESTHGLGAARNLGILAQKLSDHASIA
jgi:hypothetical protein